MGERMESTDNTGLAALIGALSRQIEEQEERQISKSDYSYLTLRQIHYVEAISVLTSPTAGEIAAYLGLRKPSVTAILDRFVELNLLRRERDPDDKRTYRIFLTERGKRLAGFHADLHLAFANRLAARLSAAEKQQLVTLLGTCLEHGEEK